MVILNTSGYFPGGYVLFEDGASPRYVSSTYDDNPTDNPTIGSGPNGYCFFNCLDYLNNQYGCGNDINFYIDGYKESYGYDGVLGGVNLQEFIDFTSSQFNSSGPISGSLISQMLDSGGSMLAVINAGGGGHAVIITNYHDITGDYFLGVYTYYDPTTGGYGIVSTSDVIMGIFISGC